MNAGLLRVDGVETREILRRYHSSDPLLQDRFKNFIGKQKAEVEFGLRMRATTADLVAQAQATAARADAGRRPRPPSRPWTADEVRHAAVEAQDHGEREQACVRFVCVLVILFFGARAGRVIAPHGAGSAARRGKRRHRRNKVKGSVSAVERPPDRLGGLPPIGPAGNTRLGIFVPCRCCYCWTLIQHGRFTPPSSSPCSVPAGTRRAASSSESCPGASGARRGR